MNSQKPTILVILNHYLPGFRAGGPIRTTANMINWLGDRFTFKILTKNHDFGDSTPFVDIQSGVWYSVGKATVRYLNVGEQSLLHFREILNSLPYDFIYLDSVFAEFTLKTILLYRIRQIPQRPLIIAPRGHLNLGALQIKSTKKRAFLRLIRMIGFYDSVIWHTSNSGEKEDVLREIVPVGGESVIWTISNLPSPLPADIPANLSMKVTGKARFIFLSRISRKKNLRFLLNLLSQVRGQVEFDIYGMIEDKVYWQECLALIAQLPEHVKVTYKGVVAFDEVSEIFSNYHLFILPTLGENFGHVILESLYSGCPVLLSDQTPWSDVQSEGIGWTVSLSDRAGFINELQNMIDMTSEAFEEISERARQYGFNYIQNSTILVQQTEALFKSVLK